MTKSSSRQSRHHPRGRLRAIATVALSGAILAGIGRWAAIVRTYGHAHTELWPVTEWPHYKAVIRELGIARA